MSIHNFRCSVQLINISIRDKNECLKKHIVSKMLALKSTLYASWLPSWPLSNLHCDVDRMRRRLRAAGHAIWTIQTSLGRRNNEQTTIILILSYISYSILNIRSLNLLLIKKDQQLHSRSANIGTTKRQPLLMAD